MMAANYRHIGGGVNRLGRHYSRFSGFWPMAPVVDQSLALRKSQNGESNRRRRANALNDGLANFPEYHNVYIEPGSFEIYEKTNVFPEGTIMFKELQLTKKPGENPDGSRTEPSGRGYFPGAFNGADVTVKDSKRFAASGAGASSISTISNQRLRPPR